MGIKAVFRAQELRNRQSNIAPRSPDRLHLVNSSNGIVAKRRLNVYITSRHESMTLLELIVQLRSNYFYVTVAIQYYILQTRLHGRMIVRVENAATSIWSGSVVCCGPINMSCIISCDYLTTRNPNINY